MHHGHLRSLLQLQEFVRVRLCGGQGYYLRLDALAPLQPDALPGEAFW